jgi:hypothetical protein
VPWLSRAGRDASPAEPIEHHANCGLDGGRIVALAPVQKAASDQAVDIALVNLDLENSETAAAPVTPSRCAAGT